MPDVLAQQPRWARSFEWRAVEQLGLPQVLVRYGAKFDAEGRMPRLSVLLGFGLKVYLVALAVVARKPRLRSSSESCAEELLRNTRSSAFSCSPCHESAVLNEKYGLRSGRLTSFIDSYHGLKSKAGDTHVANCASCHGVHRILASSDPTSTVNPANLRTTCGECHPNISEKMANTPIHGIGGQGLRTPIADVVEKIYIVAIIVIIGLMILHWVIDLFRHLVNISKKRPQLLRMHIDEVVQHALLAATFITLVISGFALRYDQGFMARFFFGWEGGFELRGLVHRGAAILFMITVAPACLAFSAASLCMISSCIHTTGAPISMASSTTGIRPSLKMTLISSGISTSSRLAHFEGTVGYKIPSASS